jgi:hypothetical protein
LFIATLAASLSLLTASAESGSGSLSAIERFFIGTTEGSGTADVIMSGKHTVRDRSQGRRDASGALLLDQTVEEQDKPPRRRTWRLVPAGGNRITGTINDVKGAVTGEVTANTLHLRYKMLDGPSVEQWITLQADGRTAKNRMIYRRIGVKVATVETVIRRVE